MIISDGGEMPARDILIGAADLYTWNHIKPWALSIKESGFIGEVWLIAYRIDEDVITKCEAEGINVYKVDHDQYMRPIQHEAPGTPTQAHNLRFYHAWELLTRLKKERNFGDWWYHRYVIMTDVRDVIFQSDPSEWLHERATNGYPLPFIKPFIIAPSENIMFEDEAWNKKNAVDSHGPVVYNELLKDREAYNVGTIAGTYDVMTNLAYSIYAMTTGRAYPADQSSFNVLIASTFKEYTQCCSMQLGWAAQCGTSFDPTKSYLWPHLIHGQPTWWRDETLTTAGLQKFVIVHQWDRNPTLKAYFSQKYGI